jgi:hypothetical protein
MLTALTLFCLWATFFHVDSIGGHVLDSVTTIYVAWMTYGSLWQDQRIAARANPN